MRTGRLGCQQLHGWGQPREAWLPDCQLVSAAVQNSPESLPLQKREGGRLASSNQFSHLRDLVSWSVHLEREARSCNVQVSFTAVQYQTLMYEPEQSVGSTTWHNHHALGPWLPLVTSVSAKDQPLLGRGQHYHPFPDIEGHQTGFHSTLGSCPSALVSFSLLDPGLFASPDCVLFQSYGTFL